MNAFSFSARRWAASLMTALLAGGLLVWAGCDDGSDADDLAGDDPRYAVGEPVQDSSIAVIVSSEYGADTLSASVFRVQMQRVMQRAPMMGIDPSQPAPLRRLLVEGFVERQVLSGAAQEADLEVDSVLVQMQIEQARSQFESEEEFEQMLASQGLTLDSLRSIARAGIRQRMMQQQLAEQAETPTEEEIETFRQERALEISAQHILFMVPPTATENVEDSVQAVAEAVLDSAQAGDAAFAALARRHSEDGSARQGGDLGYFSRGRMVPPFEEAAFALQDSGDVTDELVRTRFGYHIIRKTGEREGAPMDTSRARQQLTRERQQEAFNEGLAELRATATVRINPDVVEGVDLSEEPSIPLR